MTRPLRISSPLDLSGLRFRPRPMTSGITIHCTATPPSVDVGALDVHRWHLRRGWLAIGYHYVIRRDGSVERGRDVSVIGAHCSDGQRNLTHIGVALAGGVSANPQHIPGSKWNGSGAEANFTDEQGEALTELIRQLRARYGSPLPIEGHRDVPRVTKACPSFNVATWAETGEFKLD